MNPATFARPPASGNVGRFGYAGALRLTQTGEAAWSMRNRQYHPELGRFLQTDPIGYAGGVNLYAYVGGDPVNLTDPWGLDTFVRCRAVPVRTITVPSTRPGETSTLILIFRRVCETYSIPTYTEYSTRWANDIFANVAEAARFDWVRDDVRCQFRRSGERYSRWGADMQLSAGINAIGTGWTGYGAGFAGAQGPIGGYMSGVGALYEWIGGDPSGALASAAASRVGAASGLTGQGRDLLESAITSTAPAARLTTAPSC